MSAAVARDHGLGAWLRRDVRTGGLTVFLAILGINAAIRARSIAQVGLLNEDLGLVRSFRAGYRAGGIEWLLTFFHAPYISEFIRPFQVVSMTVEQVILGWGPRASHVVAIVVFSLGLWILWRALAHLTNPVGQLACVGLLSSSMLTVEPVLWLSDRHDLYLLVFSATAFLLVVRWMRGTLSAAWFLPLTVVTVWGAFLSNEKGSAVPVVLALATAALEVQRRARGEQGTLRSALVAWAAYAALVVSYFAFRLLVLGTLVGGYDDRLMPDRAGVELPFVGQVQEMPVLLVYAAFVLYAVTTPYLIETDPSVAVLIARLAVVGILVTLVVSRLRSESAERRRRTLLVLVSTTLCGMAALVAAGAPSLRAFFWHPYDLFTLLVSTEMVDSRVYWLGAIVFSVLAGLLFGFLSANAHGVRRAVVLGLLAVLVILGMRDLVIYDENFVRATEYSEAAVRSYEQRHDCISSALIEKEGLARVAYGVNVFGDPWFMNQALAEDGLPLCVDQSEPHPDLPATVLPGPIATQQAALGFVDAVIPQADGTTRIQGWADYGTATEIVVVVPSGTTATVISSTRPERADVAKTFGRDDLRWSGLQLDVDASPPLALGELCVALRSPDGSLHTLLPANSDLCPG
jgi:hypothetical protein